ncbi:type II toxin-antitoxin system RelE/ParE family toxin [Arenimonas alkanexedens]
MPPGGTLPLPRIFVSLAFKRWQRSAGIPDRALAISVAEMRADLIDADLGGGLVKKRMAVAGGGKRSGARAIIATRLGERWFFLYGFMKNQHTNIGHRELASLRGWAAELLALTNQALDAACKAGELHEIDQQATITH